MGAEVDEVDVADPVTAVPEEEEEEEPVTDVEIPVDTPDALALEVEVGIALLIDALEAPGIESGPGTYFVRS